MSKLKSIAKKEDSVSTKSITYTAEQRKEFWIHNLNSHTGLPAIKEKPNYNGGESIIGFTGSGEHHNISGMTSSKNY